MPKTKNTPQTVNICGLTYTIERASCGGSYGHIDFGRQRIDIKKDICRERAALALLHEITHGILHEACMYKECADETLVQVIASGFS